MLPTFTTNSINILAGVNGVEVIQALIIALSVLLNDLLFIPVWPKSLLELIGGGNPQEGRMLGWAAGEVVQRHLMSAYFMLPLVGVCAGFMWHNWSVALFPYDLELRAGIPPRPSQATPSATSPAWHSRPSPSKATLPRRLSCSSFLRSSTLCCRALSCSTSSTVLVIAYLREYPNWGPGLTR